MVSTYFNFLVIGVIFSGNYYTLNLQTYTVSTYFLAIKLKSLYRVTAITCIHHVACQGPRSRAHLPPPLCLPILSHILCSSCVVCFDAKSFRPHKSMRVMSCYGHLLQHDEVIHFIYYFCALNSTLPSINGMYPAFLLHLPNIFTACVSF